MKVKDLIKELLEQDQELDVVFHEWINGELYYRDIDIIRLLEEKMYSGEIYKSLILTTSL